MQGFNAAALDRWITGETDVTVTELRVWCPECKDSTTTEVREELGVTTWSTEECPECGSELVEV